MSLLKSLLWALTELIMRVFVFFNNTTVWVLRLECWSHHILLHGFSPDKKKFGSDRKCQGFLILILDFWSWKHLVWSTVFWPITWTFYFPFRINLPSSLLLKSFQLFNMISDGLLPRKYQITNFSNAFYHSKWSLLIIFCAAFLVAPTLLSYFPLSLGEYARSISN